MKKSLLISLIALAVSLLGLVIALATWKQKKKHQNDDDFDEALLLDDEDDYIISRDFDADEENLSYEESDEDACLTSEDLENK